MQVILLPLVSLPLMPESSFGRTGNIIFKALGKMKMGVMGIISLFRNY